MYDSPITLMVQKIAEQAAKELDEATFKAISCVVPTVDREELLKALRYDREQYDKGYADGKRDAMDELVRCKDCLYWQSGENECEKWEYCTFHNIGIGPHSFCSYGERKDGGGDG